MAQVNGTYGNTGVKSELAVKESNLQTAVKVPFLQNLSLLALSAQD